MSALPDVINTKLPHERGEIVVISDFQADNWLAVIPKTSEVSQTSEVWRRLASKAAIVLIDVGPAEPDNATVLSIASFRTREI